MKTNEEVSFLIKQIHDSVSKKANYQLNKYDVTLSQGRILAYLHQRIGMKTSQKDIEKYLGVTHPTVIGTLKRLEKKGLIKSQIDDEDKRVKNVYLTPKEEFIHQRMQGFQNQMEENLLSGLKEGEIVKLKRILKKIYNNIQD